MDVKRLRTFVTVVDLGTVSKAALRLRISQSALSRQISDLEYECGFKLFDRVGRRLFLTTRGEQVLGDCRGVLGHIGSLGERIEVLKRGDSGVLKVAAPPQTIESVLLEFLPRFAEDFPNVRVKLTEALGMDQVPLLERGEVHVGIRHDQGVNPWFESLALPPDDVLAACGRSSLLGRGGAIDLVSLAGHPLLLLDSGYPFAGCSMRLAGWQGWNRLPCSRAAHRTRCSRSPKPGKGWRSFRPYCKLIATDCASQRSSIVEDRYAIGMSYSGTSGGRCQAMPRAFAKRSPRTCASYCRLRGRP
jgi:DNA-binding transcriptional LysR family regulator